MEEGTAVRIPDSHLDLLERPVVVALADTFTQKYMNLPHYFGNVARLEQKGKLRLVACQIKPTKVVPFG
ncbi:MAG: hypothetical protein WCE68_16175 [Anaerolineales bacterium]